ncbi:MAG: glutathione synthetase [Methylomarinum sp.]|nr:SemiSWEET transporter [Methylococcales bacterium]NOR68549.1 glutathione synthetase [Methylomarinum sp.]
MSATEIIGYCAAFLTTSSFLPQAILTLKTRNTHSLSFSMYSLFTIGVLLWLIYGIQKADYAIIFANSITLLLSTSILGFKIYNMIYKEG